jgi:hypothetical protein
MEETFRPRSNYAWAVVSYLLLGLFALNSIFVGSDAGQSMIELGVCAIFTVVAHLIWVRPKLVVTDTAVRVVNPITSITIPFGASFSRYVNPETGVMSRDDMYLPNDPARSYYIVMSGDTLIGNGTIFITIDLGRPPVDEEEKEPTVCSVKVT